MPLHEAARAGCVPVIALLLNQHAFNSQDKNGNTPLHLAVESKQVPRHYS